MTNRFFYSVISGNKKASQGGAKAPARHVVRREREEQSREAVSAAGETGIREEAQQRIRVSDSDREDTSYAYPQRV